MKVPNEALKYILFQRTGYLRLTNTFAYRALNRITPFSIYNQVVTIESRINPSRIKKLFEDDIKNEYLSIKDFLPETCSSILDIGCGVAGIDVFLNYHYQDQHPTFYLLDKTHTEDSVFYAFNTKGAFYNSLNVAKTMLIENNTSERFVHLVEATDNNDIKIYRNVDLIISLISWGFHYPVETYLEKAYSLLVKGGSMIIDVRKGTNGIAMIKSLFDEVKIILDAEKFQRVLALKYLY